MFLPCNYLGISLQAFPGYIFIHQLKNVSKYRKPKWLLCSDFIWKLIRETIVHMILYRKPNLKQTSIQILLNLNTHTELLGEGKILFFVIVQNMNCTQIVLFV